MAKTEKTPNYSPEQTLALVSAFQTADTDEKRAAVVAEYAEKFAKSGRSIIMKLVKEGVYIKKTAVDKTGQPVIKKEEMADTIATFLPELSENDVSAFSKLTKKGLNALIKKLSELSEFRRLAEEQFSDESELETAD